MIKYIPIELTKADVEILQQKTLAQGFYRLEKIRLRHKRFNGEWSKEFDRDLMIPYRVAAVLPYDPKLDQVVLIEQFRIGALQDENSPWLLELVAGIRMHNEDLQQLAISEAQEEANLKVKKLIPICDYWSSPGGTNEKVALYLAYVDTTNAGGVYGLADENEDIRVHVLSTQDAFAAVRSGRINNAVTIIALQWLELNLSRLA